MMQGSISSGASTLSDLHPSLWDEWVWNQPYTGIRPQGSFLRNRPQLSRTPEYVRAYAPGDPIQLIDWRAFAREEQLLVRAHRNEIGERIRLIIDVADSMFWPDAEALDLGKPPVDVRDQPSSLKNHLITKTQLALRLALHLSYGYLKLGNIVDLFFVGRHKQIGSSELSLHVLPLTQAENILNFFEEAHNHQWQESFLTTFIAGLAEVDSTFTNKNYRLNYVLSDGINDFDKVLDLVKVGGGKSLFFQALSSYELQDDWLRAGVSYYDKHAQTREMLGQELQSQSQYLQAVQNWCSGLEEHCHREGVTYLLLHDKYAITEYLLSLHALLSDKTFWTGK